MTYIHFEIIVFYVLFNAVIMYSKDTSSPISLFFVLCGSISEIRSEDNPISKSIVIRRSISLPFYGLDMGLCFLLHFELQAAVRGNDHNPIIEVVEDNSVLFV